MATPIYALAANLQQAAGGEARLLELTDFDNDGAEDPGVVDGVLCEAEGIVNSYVRKVHSVPLVAPIAPSITTVTAELAIYMLKSRRNMLTENDLILAENRDKWLAGIASGKVDLGVTPTTAPSPHNPSRPSDRPSAKAVSRENMKGFA